MSCKKFAVLLCAQDSKYVKETYGGYLGVFKNLLAEEAETWDGYDVRHGEFPDENEVELYDGFVITGSCCDAHGGDPWISTLIDLVKKLDAHKKRVLGICFGHQILVRAMGGAIGRAMSWDIGHRTIELSTESTFFPSSLDLPEKLSILEVHRDEVEEIPPKGEVLAKSDATPIEMFAYGDHFLGIQGHPEYTNDVLIQLLDRLVEQELITEAYADEVKLQIAKGEPDRESWKKLCINFLKGRF